MKEVTYNSSLLKDSWNSNETVKSNNFNELSGAVKNVIANANDLAHNYLQQGKQYVAGDIVYSKNLNKGCYLVCTQGGATGDSEPQLINKNVGETVTDGAVTWTVQKVSNALSLGGNLPEAFALLNSPPFSGVPTAPTAAKTVNNNQIATTAFVHLLAGAANNGGIVDSLLAQNGYVKFANGLILQWGYNRANLLEGYIVITFPTAYSGSVFSVVGVPTATLGAADLAAYSITSVSQTNFTVVGDALTNGVKTSYIRWISVGC